MGNWAARQGAQAARSIRRSTLAAGLMLLVCAHVAGCAETELVQAIQKTSVTVGQPSVTPPAGSVQNREPPKPGDYTQTNPFQIDSFEQKAVAKVDVLWVIDNSGSMGPKQAKIARDFQDFITQLTSPGANQEVIDYHIGITTTDTYDATQSGVLQNPEGLRCASTGQLCPWIGPDTVASIPVAVDKFQKMAKVGTSGSGDEKGMLAAEMALTEPLVSGPNAGFLRADASLALIIVSDEEDSSCSPVRASQEGCDESAITSSPIGYGTTDFYTRFFKKVKGFGNEALVSMSVFVGTTQDYLIPMSSTSGIPNGQRGCLVSGASSTDPLAYAVYAPRYMDVSTAVSGPSSVHSICDGDFSAAAQSIYKYAVLQSVFFLSRLPADAEAVQGCVDGVCHLCDQDDGTLPAGWFCAYDSSRNAVRFATVPLAGSTIKISYKVHANAG